MGSEISTFCNDNYEREIAIFDSPDDQTLPSEEDCPFVTIYRNEMMLGEAVNSWGYSYEIVVAVSDETVDESLIDDLIVKQNGVRRVEELSFLIYDAITKNMPCNGNIDEAKLDIDESQHPLYIGFLDLTINVPQVIGAQVLL